MTLPECPHCGCGNMFVKAQARGPVELFFDEDGDEAGAFTDKMYFVPSHVVRCMKCGARRRDLRVEGRKIVEAEE
jgi:hypothetical protein